jgi:hypothetical protein
MTFNQCILVTNSSRILLVFVLIFGSLFIGQKSFAAETKIAANALSAKYTELSTQLLNNQYQRELYLNSVETSHNLKGEIYAVVDYPFATVKEALNSPEHWCDVLILHVNIKYCHASASQAGTIFAVYLGKKDPQLLADAYRVAFKYHEVNATPDYFAIELNADDGPLSTHDYRIWIEATTLKNGRTFLHFTYAYAFGFAGRVAMQAYLATSGRNKVGFTASGNLPSGQPAYIQGVRGVVERNTMRYYLAIDAYLSAMTSPPQARLEERFQQWYSSTEQYPIQLHEIERDDYIKMKHNEYRRQQVAQ